MIEKRATVTRAPLPGEVIYIAYWGLTEPLGEALILPSLLKLTESGLKITLITFEKERDYLRPGQADRFRHLLCSHGIQWRALRYHGRPQIPAKLLDVCSGLVFALRPALRRRDCVIHARTYVGGLIGMFLHLLTGRRLVFHNEGFWPDQQVEAGVWSPGSWPYRIAKRLERSMYAAADGLILLTEESRAHVQPSKPAARRRTPTIIVPSCVDMERFTCGRRARRQEPLRLVYLGSLGGRYLVEPVAIALRAFRRQDPGTRLSVVTHTEHGWVRSTLGELGLTEEDYDLKRVPHEAVPAVLCTSDVGLFFISSGLGSISCSPTKIGEYLACGLPVLTGPGLGTLNGEIVARRAGVVVDSARSEALEAGAAEMVSLLDDPELAGRCRRAAADLFGLEHSIERQLELYAQLTT